MEVPCAKSDKQRESGGMLTGFGCRCVVEDEWSKRNGKQVPGRSREEVRVLHIIVRWALIRCDYCFTNQVSGDIARSSPQ